MLSGGDIKVGGPIPYRGMTEEMDITKQDVVNFVHQLWQPHGQNGHWFWLPAMKNRSAKFKTERSGLVRPSYFIWQAARGMPPKDKNVILHTCLEEMCVNPDHLRNHAAKELSTLRRIRKSKLDAFRQLEKFKQVKKDNLHFFEQFELDTYVKELETLIGE